MDVSEAIISAFKSKVAKNLDGEPYNVVDAIVEITDAADRIAESIESVANAIEGLADAIRARQ